MNWRFWELKKNRAERLFFTQITEQLAAIANRLGNMETLFKNSQQQVDNIDGQLVQNTDQLTETATQLQKLARIHYKTSQETQNKLDKLTDGMEVLKQWQEQYLENTVQLQLKDKQVNVLAEVMIKQLDDLDYIRRALKDNEGENWRQMLEQWTAQLVQALARAGFMEIDLYGKSFDPRLAEAIATVTGAEALKMCSTTSQETLLPYQVVAVTRRGFVTPEGYLLRKAQVITVQEDEHIVQNHQ